MSIAAGTGLPALAELLAEVVDAKRVRVAGAAGTLASRRFLGAWAALRAGEPVRRVALTEAGAAVCAARLGGIDAQVLTEAGLSAEQVAGVLDRAVAQFGAAVPTEVRAAASALGPGSPSDPRGHPSWAAALAEQPRAGATRPGHPRLMLDPAESHAEHCWVVAVGAVLLAGHYGADPELPFLCGLAHHLHNAVLPDAGFAGEALLGEHLEPVLERLTERALDELPEPLAAQTREARRLLAGAASPEARAFHAADVLDRVLEMRHHARKAAFTLDQALDELDLVHDGPLQAFGLGVLEEAGLR